MAEWPAGISDGLTLPCGVCGVIPRFDWECVDDVWSRVAPPEHRLSVICLPCFEGLAVAAGETRNYLISIQFVGEGRTWHFREPARMYTWQESTGIRSSDDE